MAVLGNIRMSHIVGNEGFVRYIEKLCLGPTQVKALLAPVLPMARHAFFVKNRLYLRGIVKKLFGGFLIVVGISELFKKSDNKQQKK